MAFDINRNDANTRTRSSYQRTSPSGTRPVRAFDNSGSRNQSYQNGSRTSNYNNVRSNSDSRNASPRSYTTPSGVQQNQSVTRERNTNYQSRPSYNQNVQTRSPNTVTREYNNSNNNSRQAPATSQPRQQVERQQNVSAPRQSASPRSESSSRSSESNSSSRSSDSNRR